MTATDGQPPAAQPDTAHLLRGLEFLGRYDQSGYQGEQYLIRRSDGQVLRLSQLLYLVVEGLAKSASLEEAAEHVTAAFGRFVSRENIEYLIENKLRQLGLFEPGPDDTAAALGAESEQSPAVERQSAGILSLRFRHALLPARAHMRITVALQRLFASRVVCVVALALLAADAWLLADGAGHVLGGATQTISHPGLLLLLLGLFAVSNAFHEFGHAAATTYGGAKPGPMGVGIYIAMPVFFTDVTDSYRLDRRGRLRVDLGGVYFNAIVAVLVTLVYIATRFQPLLLFAVLVQMEALIQFLPFIRLDGYYVVADLIGIPDPFAFVPPVLARMLRRKTPTNSPSLALLTPKARRAVTSWVVLTVPILAAELVLTALMAPTVAPAFWDSISRRANTFGHAVSSAHVVLALASAVDIVLLAIVPLGISLIFAMLAIRGARRVHTARTSRRGSVLVEAARVATGLGDQPSSVISTPLEPAYVAAPGAPASDDALADGYPAAPTPRAPRPPVVVDVVVGAAGPMGIALLVRSLAVGSLRRREQDGGRTATRRRRAGKPQS